MVSAIVAASNMTLNIVGGGLFVLGAALLFVTIALMRSAVADPEVLAPLEVMADRKFARADDTKRADLLDNARLVNAEPVDVHSVVTTLVREPMSEPIRPWRDPFPHDDDAVDIIETDFSDDDIVEDDEDFVDNVSLAPPIIDPLLQQHRKGH